jgi:hypothetical protein
MEISTTSSTKSGTIDKVLARAASRAFPVSHPRYAKSTLPWIKSGFVGKVVVGMRSKKYWLNAVPAVENVPFLKNPRNPHISPANTGAELFQRIVEALR